MAFEELTSRQAVMWGSAPFENIAPLISEMHQALVERLAPAPGEQWLDLGCGAGDVAFLAAHAGAIVTGSDLSPELVEAARRRAAALGLTATLEVADCQELPYDDASFDVVSSSVGVIFAPDHPRVAQRADPGVPARRPPRPDRLAQVERRRRDVRRDGAVHAAAASGRRLRVPVGRGGLRRVDARRRLRAHLRGARHAPTGDDGARCGILPRQLRPRSTLWSSLDEERQRATRCRHDGVLRELSRRTTGSACHGLYIVVTGVRKG